MSIYRIALLTTFVLQAALLHGCLDTNSKSDSERAPIGKADSVGSCSSDSGATFCGDQSAGNCWCDDLCESFGDCCLDKASVCDPVADVCPQTCGEFCPMAADCTLPDGCENPGCGCPEAVCDPVDVCPQACGEFCPMAADCTLPDGCENPGCGCPEAVCETECELAGGDCFGGTINCEVIVPGTDIASLSCGASGPLAPQLTCCLPD